MNTAKKPLIGAYFLPEKKLPKNKQKETQENYCLTLVFQNKMVR